MLLVIISVPVTAVTVVPPCPTLSRTYPAKEAASSRIHATRNSHARIPRHSCINETNSNPLRGTHGSVRGARTEESGPRCARVEGKWSLHCTFKRPSLLCDSHPFAYYTIPPILRDYSAMTNEGPVLRGSHPRPPCSLSAITPRELPTPRATYSLLLSSVKQIDGGRSELTTERKEVGRGCARWFTWCRQNRYLGYQ